VADVMAKKQGQEADDYLAHGGSRRNYLDKMADEE
jgi:hypothetical protein